MNALLYAYYLLQISENPFNIFVMISFPEIEFVRLRPLLDTKTNFRFI